MAENENAGNVGTLNNPSQSGQDTSSEMLKPWMKTLGKDFYQNKELAQYDSLKDAVNALLDRPKKKQTPDEYGYGDADEIFRKAGVSKEEADEIEKYYVGKMPERKDRKEVFGDKFDEEDRYYAKAVEQFCDSDLVKKNGLDRDPAFVKAMAKVGRELGQASFNSSTRDGQKKMNPWEGIRKKYSNG